MSQFYDGMRALANDLLTEFKQGSIAYVKATEGDGGTPDAPPLPTLTSYPINAVARGVQYKYVMRNLALATDVQVMFSYVVGAVASEGDQALWDALSEAITDASGEAITVMAETSESAIIAPDMLGYIDINGARHKIVQIIPKPLAEPVAYTLICRR